MVVDRIRSVRHTDLHLLTPDLPMAHPCGRLHQARRRHGTGTRSSQFMHPRLRLPRLSNKLRRHRNLRSKTDSAALVIHLLPQPREVLVSVLVRIALCIVLFDLANILFWFRCCRWWRHYRRYLLSNCMNPYFHGHSSDLILAFTATLSLP